MCVGCNLSNGERTKLIDNPATSYKVFLENCAGIFRLHMTNGRHHTTKDIGYCPFCGRKLNE